MQRRGLMVRDAEVTKLTDVATPALLLASTGNKQWEIETHMTKQGAAGRSPVWLSRSTKAIISSYHFSGEGATTRPFESTSSNFKKLDVK